MDFDQVNLIDWSDSDVDIQDRSSPEPIITKIVSNYTLEDIPHPDIGKNKWTGATTTREVILKRQQKS